jgi:hypothetical protein
MSAQNKSDFVNVRLSDAGRNFAGPNGTVRIANAHMNYKFNGDQPQRVLTSEWSKVFSAEKYDGNPIFELVPPAIAAAPAPVKAAVVPQLTVVPAAESKEK